MEYTVDGFETDLAALEDLPETESIEAGGHGGGGCGFTCVIITCVITDIL